VKTLEEGIMATMGASAKHISVAITVLKAMLMVTAVIITMPVLAGPPQDFTPVDITRLSENKARSIQMFRACDVNHDHELTKSEVELCEHPRVVPLRASWENNLNNTMSEKELQDMQQYAQGWVDKWVAEYRKGNAGVFRIYQSNAVLGMISEGMLPMSAETRRPWAKASAADVVKVVKLKYGADIPGDLVSVIPETEGETMVKPQSEAAYGKPVTRTRGHRSPAAKSKQKDIRQVVKKPPCVIKPVMTDADVGACR